VFGLKPLKKIGNGGCAALGRKLANGIAAVIDGASEFLGLLPRCRHAPSRGLADGGAALAAIGFAAVIEHETDRARRRDPRPEAGQAVVVRDNVASLAVLQGRWRKRPHQLVRELDAHVSGLPCPHHVRTKMCMRCPTVARGVNGRQ
jgi:hypothetical protein